MKIELGPEQVKEFVQAAIMDSISAESRDAIVAKAVESLITPRESTYGFRKNSTPLQEAFDGAVQSAARQIVQERLEVDTVMQKAILDVVSPVLAEIAKGTWDGLPERIGEAAP